MSLIIPIAIDLDFYVEAPIQGVFDVLADVPRSVSHFPSVEQLVSLGDNQYRWEMEKMGTEKYFFQVKYTTRYEHNDVEKWVRWFPIKEGNGEFSGCWQLRQEQTGTHIHFENAGHLTLPLPRLARLVAKPFVTRKFHELFGIYVNNLKQTFTGLTQT